MVPITKTNPIMLWVAAQINYDPQQQQAYERNNFHGAEPEFYFTKYSYTKKIYSKY